MSDLSTQERGELELRRGWMSRNPFCPDHRDKVQGLSCRQCEIERLTRNSAKLLEALREVWAHSDKFNTDHGITRTPEMQRMYLRAQKAIAAATGEAAA